MAGEFNELRRVSVTLKGFPQKQKFWQKMFPLQDSFINHPEDMFSTTDGVFYWLANSQLFEPTYFPHLFQFGLFKHHKYMKDVYLLKAAEFDDDDDDDDLFVSGDSRSVEDDGGDDQKH